MTWSQSYSHQWLLSLDLYFAGVIFNRSGITISTMAGLVRAGKDGPLKLYRWQRAFLRWLAPRLSAAHCIAAREADIGRARLALELMGAAASNIGK